MPSIQELVRKCGSVASKEIQYINWGGCAVYAKLLRAALVKQGCTRFRYRVLNYHGNNATAVSKRLGRAGNCTDRWRGENCGVSHVMLEFVAPDGSKWLADSEYIIPLPPSRCRPLPGKGWQLCPGCIPTQLLELMADTAGNWSTEFDRDDIPMLQSIINVVIGGGEWTSNSHIQISLAA